jgi:hypothetical protein
MMLAIICVFVVTPLKYTINTQSKLKKNGTYRIAKKEA